MEEKIMLLTVLGAVSVGIGVGGSIGGAIAVVTGTSEATAIAIGTLSGASCGLLAVAGDAVLDALVPSFG